MKKKKIFFTDLDGTIVSPAETLYPGAKDLIHSFVQNGWYYLMATARSRSATAWINAEIGISPIGSINYNGASIYTGTDTMLYSITPLQLDRFFRSIDAFNGSFRVHSLAEGIVGIGECKWPQDHLPYYRPRYIQSPNEASLLTDVAKITFRGSEQECRTLMNLCNEQKLSVFNTKPNLIEIFSEQVNKAKSAKILLDLLGERNDLYIVAIGDGLNDVPLLQLADVAITFSESDITVQRVANIVVGPPEKGGLHVVSGLLTRG